MWRLSSTTVLDCEPCGGCFFKMKKIRHVHKLWLNTIWCVCIHTALCLEEMSKTLARRRFLWDAVRLIRLKYFWAWLATWEDFLEVTNLLAIPFQSPFPSFSNPSKNDRCSSSLHGFPTYTNIKNAFISTNYKLESWK